MVSYTYRAGDVEVTLSADTVEEVVNLHKSLHSNNVAGEWIEWRGGYCPVDKESRVEYRMRNGDEGVSYAKSLRWSHLNYPGDIVGYSVL